ncbi:NAD(P)/FAD-dependent oxidoreductase [Clavibacter tessellarius]|uniref:NAD(P)/FAD-dependent oxidoreductase n=1 Tax=Clavibacter tessellarius TaxID=31965 RepID=UPI003252156B
MLATGAHDRTLPFPGWDLPGVFTAGAAQALAKGERVAIGDRVIVAGAGPFLLPVAVSLVQAGARVVGIHEAARVPSLARGWLRDPLGLARAPHKAAELAGYVSVLARERIGYSTGSAVVAAHGTDRVEAVTVQRLDATWAPIPGTERRIPVDAVCVGHGFTPRLEPRSRRAAASGPTASSRSMPTRAPDPRASSPRARSRASGEWTRRSRRARSRGTAPRADPRPTPPSRPPSAAGRSRTTWPAASRPRTASAPAGPAGSATTRSRAAARRCPSAGSAPPPAPRAPPTCAP